MRADQTDQNNVAYDGHVASVAPVFFTSPGLEEHRPKGWCDSRVVTRQAERLQNTCMHCTRSYGLALPTYLPSNWMGTLVLATQHTAMWLGFVCAKIWHHLNFATKLISGPILWLQAGRKSTEESQAWWMEFCQNIGNKANIKVESGQCYQILGTIFFFGKLRLQTIQWTSSFYHFHSVSWLQCTHAASWPYFYIGIKFLCADLLLLP